MDLDVSDHNGLRLVSVPEGRVDAAVALEFKNALRQSANDGPHRVVLDLSNVDFLDSSGLGAVIGVMKSIAPDQRLELTGLHGAVEKVFKLTRMDSVFLIHANRHAALKDTRHAS